MMTDVESIELGHRTQATRRGEPEPGTSEAERLDAELLCDDVGIGAGHRTNQPQKPVPAIAGAGLFFAGLELLFPSRCPLCAKKNAPTVYPKLCRGCIDRLESDRSDLCRTCGASVAMSAGSRNVCAQCRGKRFFFERTIPLGLYRDRLRDVIIRMKGPRAAGLATSVGQQMAIRAMRTLGDDFPDLIVFPPMHWRRRWSRGVNNPERLARAFCREANVKLASRLVACTRQTRKQSLLSVHQRRENVRGAFRVRGNKDLEGRHIGLLDDTMTTGATANEISRVLVRAGAGRVTLFLAARGDAS